MGEKYLQSKSGSLEDLATQIASKKSEVKVEQKVKLEQPKTYFDVKENSITAVAAKVVTEGLDPVNKDAVKKDFKNRQDKDIDNDGDVDSTDKYLHTRRQAISKATKSETHTFTAQPLNKKQKDTKGEKEIIKPIKEGKMKDIATDKAELKRLSTRLSQLKDRKAADTGDTTKIEKDILQTQKSIKDVQLRLKDVPKEVKNEKVDEPYAVGMATAMKATGDKPPLKKSTITKAHDIAKKIMKKEQAISKAAIDKFHTKLDKLVHKSFGHSSDEKKTKTEKKTYSNLRAEVDNGKKTMTGQKPAVINTEPKTTHI